MAERTCSIGNCGGPVLARKMCSKHYARWRSTGGQTRKFQTTCSIPGCGRKHYGRGMCRTHYLRWRKYGDPLATPRFDVWSKVDQTGGPDACWPWTKARDRDGYGVTKIGGRQWRVCRWVLTQTVGRDLEDHELSRHACDNPVCCNPRHIIVGTAAENSDDMKRRGRQIRGGRHWVARNPIVVRGERNPASRLTEGDVRAIRTKYADGARQVDLAAEFGITQGMVSSIIRRASWKHIE